MTNPMHNPTPLNRDDLRLTTEERSSMHGAMRAFMHEHPVRERAPFFSPMFMRVGMSVAGVVLLCGGTAFAAEQSLPNDTLYGVKVNVIEPTLLSLAFTSSQEARVNSLLVERRLEEAEELIADNALDTETATELQARTSEHADAVQVALKEVAAGGDVQSALEIGSDLEATLDAHTEIAAALADDSASPTDDAFSEIISDQSDEIEDTNNDTEDQLATEPKEDNDAYARDAKDAADEALAQLRERLATPSEDPDANTRGAALLQKSLDAYGVGNEKLTAGDTDDAASAFQDAVQAATQGMIILDAHGDVSAE